VAAVQDRTYSIMPTCQHANMPTCKHANDTRRQSSPVQSSPSSTCPDSSRHPDCLCSVLERGSDPYRTDLAAAHRASPFGNRSSGPNRIQSPSAVPHSAHTQLPMQSWLTSAPLLPLLESSDSDGERERGRERWPSHFVPVLSCTVRDDDLHLPLLLISFLPSRSLHSRLAFASCDCTTPAAAAAAESREQRVDIQLRPRTSNSITRNCSLLVDKQPVLSASPPFSSSFYTPYHFPPSLSRYFVPFSPQPILPGRVDSCCVALDNSDPVSGIFETHSTHSTQDLQFYQSFIRYLNRPISWVPHSIITLPSSDPGLETVKVVRVPATRPIKT
jgi:hypothetical protein